MYTGSPVTRSGVAWPASVPSPGCPWSLLPQVHTEVTTEMPLVAVATEESQPAEMLVTWDRPATLAGTALVAGW